MGNPARTQELKIAIGYSKQPGTGLKTTTPTELQTILAAGYHNLNIGAFNAPFPQFNQEDDGAFYGKGDEWVRTIFPTSIDAPWEWPSFLTSQNFAQVAAYALGKVSASGATYTITPMIPATDGVNLPATTILAGIREGTGDEIVDMAIIGAICQGFTLKLDRGPGLQNSSLVSRWLGCGKYNNNSGIVIPDRSDETRLGSGSSSSLLINGTDYLANARFVELEFSYDNGINPASGYHPGSGSQGGFDIRGRMRYGRRSMSLVWTVELESDSDELAKLIAGTTGPATLTVTDTGTSESAEIHLPSTRNKAFGLVDADGFTAARIETDILGNDSLGPLVITATTDRTGICA